MTKPPIGVPRVVTGPLTLYPGERAHVHKAVPISAAPIPDSAELSIMYQVTEWLVEPVPGWHGAWLRWSWRLFFRWLPFGSPKLTTHFDALKAGPDAHRR